MLEQVNEGWMHSGDSEGNDDSEKAKEISTELQSDIPVVHFTRSRARLAKTAVPGEVRAKSLPEKRRSERSALRDKQFDRRRALETQKERDTENSLSTETEKSKSEGDLLAQTKRVTFEEKKGVFRSTVKNLVNRVKKTVSHTKSDWIQLAPDWLQEEEEFESHKESLKPILKASIRTSSSSTIDEFDTAEEEDSDSDTVLTQSKVGDTPELAGLETVNYQSNLVSGNWAYKSRAVTQDVGTRKVEKEPEEAEIEENSTQKWYQPDRSTVQKSIASEEDKNLGFLESSGGENDSNQVFQFNSPLRHSTPAKRQFASVANNYTTGTLRFEVNYRKRFLPPTPRRAPLNTDRFQWSLQQQEAENWFEIVAPTPQLQQPLLKPTLFTKPEPAPDNLGVVVNDQEIAGEGQNNLVAIVGQPGGQPVPLEEVESDEEVILELIDSDEEMSYATPAIFRGTSAEDAQGWLTHVTWWLSTTKAGAPNAGIVQKLHQVAVLFQDAAQTWFAALPIGPALEGGAQEENPPRVRTWERFTEVFLARFRRDAGDRTGDVVALLQTKQQQGQTVEEFVHKLQKQGNVIGATVAEIYMAVVTGLRQDLKAQIMQFNPETIEEVIRRGKVAERYPVSHPEAASSTSPLFRATSQTDLQKLILAVQELSLRPERSGVNPTEQTRGRSVTPPRVRFSETPRDNTPGERAWQDRPRWDRGVDGNRFRSPSPQRNLSTTQTGNNGYNGGSYRGGRGGQASTGQSQGNFRAINSGSQFQQNRFGGPQGQQSYAPTSRPQLTAGYNSEGRQPWGARPRLAEQCGNCGRPHGSERPCPARGTTCSGCGKMNHWRVMCRNAGSSRFQPTRGGRGHGRGFGSNYEVGNENRPGFRANQQ